MVILVLREQVLLNWPSSIQFGSREQAGRLSLLLAYKIFILFYIEIGRRYKCSIRLKGVR